MRFRLVFSPLPLRMGDVKKDQLILDTLRRLVAGSQVCFNDMPYYQELIAMMNLVVASGTPNTMYGVLVVIDTEDHAIQSSVLIRT